MAEDSLCSYCGTQFSNSIEFQAHYWNCIQSAEVKEQIKAEEAKLEEEEAKIIAENSRPDRIFEATQELKKKSETSDQRYSTLLQRHNELTSAHRNLMMDHSKLVREVDNLKLAQIELGEWLKITNKGVDSNRFWSLIALASPPR